MAGNWPKQQRMPPPDSVQHLLDRAHWDCDALRDDLVDYLVQELGDEDGILVVDETGFLKKGQSSAGVQRQYSGTAGRIENCQIGVFLSYASQYGHALVDRELYLPRSWADDIPRRAAAKVPESVEFATKPELAHRMIERAVAAKMPFAWITGDEVYGNDRHLRIWLEQEGLHFVLAVAGNQYVWRDMQGESTVAKLVDSIPDLQWQRLSAGAGAKGPRWYEWASIPLLSWRSGFCVVGVGRSNCRSSIVGHTSFMSCRFAPSTTIAIGIPCASVNRLRLTPPLPRSVGLGPGFFPSQRCFGHGAIHRQPRPIDAIERIERQ
jgi:hypothetical protein